MDGHPDAYGLCASDQHPVGDVPDDEAGHFGLSGHLEPGEVMLLQVLLEGM